MTALAWALVVLATLFQLMNVVLALRKAVGRGGSQLLLVPCVLWYVALVIRGESFFLSSKGVEIGAVVMVHLILTLTVPLVGALFSRAKRAA
jgi:hypothetical protein